MKSVPVTAALLSALLFWGCNGRNAGDSTQHPLYVRGRKLLENDKPEKAAQAFKNCLRVAPHYEKAHLQLGVIYQDRGDLIGSAYHFHNFLTKAGADAPNRKIVKKWLQSTEEKFVEKALEKSPAKFIEIYKKRLAGHPAAASGASPDSGESGRQITERERKLAEQVKALTTRVMKLRKKLEQARSASTGEKKNPQAASGTKPQQSPADSESDGAVATYTVKEGDTLYGICKEQYGNGELWKKLKKYNMSRSREAGGQLQPGTRLELPAPQKLRKIELE